MPDSGFSPMSTLRVHPFADHGNQDLLSLMISWRSTISGSIAPAIASAAHPPKILSLSLSPAPPPPPLSPSPPLVEQQAGGRDAPPEILRGKSVARNSARQVTKSDAARTRASHRDGVFLFSPLKFARGRRHTSRTENDRVRHREEIGVLSLITEILPVRDGRGYSRSAMSFWLAPPRG